MDVQKIGISATNPPQKFKVGDKVIITNPEFVLRVGYPLSYEDAYKHVVATYGKDLRKFLDSTIYKSETDLDTEFSGQFKSQISFEHRDMKKMFRGFTLLYMESVGFGGPERTIHVEKHEAYQGRIFEVESKRICHTGTYDPPWSYQDHNGEWDCYSGGLHNRKTHTLLELRGHIGSIVGYKDQRKFSGLWIESCNVRKHADSL